MPRSLTNHIFKLKSKGKNIHKKICKKHLCRKSVDIVLFLATLRERTLQPFAATVQRASAHVRRLSLANLALTNSVATLPHRNLFIGLKRTLCLETNSVYGLNHAPVVWNETIIQAIMGFKNLCTKSALMIQSEEMLNTLCYSISLVILWMVFCGLWKHEVDTRKVLA